MRECTNLVFIIPTKRLEKMPARMPFDWYARKEDRSYDNIIFGISAGSMLTLEKNNSEIIHRAVSLFISCEPMLEKMKLGPYLGLSEDGTTRIDKPKFSWVIVGGESGPGYRPMDDEWAREIRDACKAAGVPFYFKQHAGPRPGMGPTLDGVAHREFPIRESTPGAHNLADGECPVCQEFTYPYKNGQCGSCGFEPELEPTDGEDCSL
jgi:protein gp37